MTSKENLLWWVDHLYIIMEYIPGLLCNISIAPNDHGISIAKVQERSSRGFLAHQLFLICVQAFERYELFLQTFFKLKLTIPSIP